MFKGSIPALVTPFTQEGEVDYETLDSLMQWHIQCNTDAIVLCGITGESPTLTVDEQKQIVSRGVEWTKGTIPIIAGTGCASTYLTMKQTEAAQRAGADACLVIVPYCNRPTPKGCFQHFEAISTIGLPMIVYHHPSRTNVKLPLAELAEILRLPNVVGVKEGSADLIYTTELMALSNVPIFCGDDILTPALMALGAQGVISIVANIIPCEWKKICAHFLNEEFEQGRQLFRRYQKLIEAMTVEINPQCVKYALSLIQKCPPFLRLPLVEPETASKKKIQDAVEACISIQMVTSAT